MTQGWLCNVGQKGCLTGQVTPRTERTLDKDQDPDGHSLLEPSIWDYVSLSNCTQQMLIAQKLLQLRKPTLPRPQRIFFFDFNFRAFLSPEFPAFFFFFLLIEDSWNHRAMTQTFHNLALPLLDWLTLSSSLWMAVSSKKVCFLWSTKNSKLNFTRKISNIFPQQNCSIVQMQAPSHQHLELSFTNQS